MRIVMLAIALAACGAEAPAPAAPNAPSQTITLESLPSWENARAAGIDFRGVGQEPGWLVDIYERERIVLLLDYGESISEFPLTGPRQTQEGAKLYQTQSGARTLSVTIRRLPCQDAMSGEAFPATVEASIDGRTLSGCGRTV